MITPPRPQGARERGFTLIELLVVIIVIGVLAAIAVPVFLNQRKKSVDAALKHDLRNAATVVEAWLADGHTESELPANWSWGYAFPGTPYILGDHKIRSSYGYIQIGAAPGGIGYCLTAQAPGATEATGNNGVRYWYDSAAGGFTGKALGIPERPQRGCT